MKHLHLLRAQKTNSKTGEKKKKSGGQQEISSQGNSINQLDNKYRARMSS